MSWTVVTQKEAPEVFRVVRAAFPDYRKKKVAVEVFGPHRINSYWGGGSRSEYCLVDLSTMQRKPLPTSTHPFFDVMRKTGPGENDAIQVDSVGNVTLKVLPNGVALVEAGTFCGKPATAVVMVNAGTLTPMLPAPKEVVDGRT